MYFLGGSLLGAKKSLFHDQIGLLWGFISKFPTSIPTPFICGVPPGYIFPFEHANYVNKLFTAVSSPMY